MEYDERLIPVAAEAGPRGELTDEETTSLDNRISEVRGFWSGGLAVDSACNPDEMNGLASAVESQQVGDPSLGGVTGELAELGPGLTYSPSLSSVRKAYAMPQLRQEDLTVAERIHAGSEGESEAVQSTAFQGEIPSPWRRSLPRRKKLRDAALEAY